MTFEIGLVLGILVVSLILFISEIVRMDVVALLVLGTLAITGLVDSKQAFAGFSNSAVITVWAMFILSEGLTRTGIADIIGRQVMRIGGSREVTLDFRHNDRRRRAIGFHGQYRRRSIDAPGRCRSSAPHRRRAISLAHAAGLLDVARWRHDAYWNTT